VTVPGTPTGNARVRVICADNIFFDISNVDFTITGTGSVFGLFLPIVIAGQ